MDMLETREGTPARPRVRPSHSCLGAATERASSPRHVARRPARPGVELVPAASGAPASPCAVEPPIADGLASAPAPRWGAVPYLPAASSNQVDGLQLYLLRPLVDPPGGLLRGQRALPPIRLPSHTIDSIGRLSKAEQRLTQELGRYPTDLEVCQALGVSIGKLADLRQALDRPCSLETPIGQDGDAEPVDMVEDHAAPTPLSAALAASLREQVERVLATLDPRERTVISLRFGLDDHQPPTIEGVGRALRITKERVRQIESRALRKLRHTTRSRWLVEYAE